MIKITYLLLNKFLNKYDVISSTFYPYEMYDTQKFIIIQFIKNNYKHNDFFTNNPNIHKKLNLFFSQYYSTESPCFIGKFQRINSQRTIIMLDHCIRNLYGLILIKPIKIITNKKVLKTNYFPFSHHSFTKDCLWKKS